MRWLTNTIISLFILLALINHAQAGQVDKHVVEYQGDLLIVNQREYPRRAEIMLLEYRGGVRVCQSGGEKYYAGMLVARVKRGAARQEIETLLSRYGLAGKPVGDLARGVYMVEVPEKFERQWGEALVKEQLIVSAKPDIMNFLADPGPPLKVE